MSEQPQPTSDSDDQSGETIGASSPGAAGTTEKDYYRGHVTEATAEQRTWVEARRGAEAAEPGSAGADRATGHMDGKPSVEGSVAR